MKKLVVIVPAYNEEKTIKDTLAGLFSIKQGLDKIGYELIVHVINDGSTDATEEFANDYGDVLVISHKKNKGLGAAVRTGLLSANDINADILVKYDADLQHDPSDILTLIEPILHDEADVVYGNRFEKMSYKMPFVRKMGNRVFTNLMKWLTGWPLMDSQPGILAVNNLFLSNFYLPGDYNYTQQILLDAYHRNLRFSHVLVSFKKRNEGKSFISLSYPFKVIPQMIQVIVGIKPLKVFGPIGWFFLSLGILVFLFQIISFLLDYTQKPVENVNLVLGSFLFGLQILCFGFLADLVVKMNRNVIEVLERKKNRHD
ncbi:glycosyltransferase family 2 protein [Candidatus Pelagibacter sp.]|nr:glycosyltransferase family 2 protein [Candidatus Pelagibacter sp.]